MSRDLWAQSTSPTATVLSTIPCDLKGANRIVLICYDEAIVFERCFCAKAILSVRHKATNGYLLMLPIGRIKKNK